MSVIAIPFKNEDPNVVLANIRTAAGHSRIEEVWAIGHTPDIRRGVDEIIGEGPARIILFPEERLGSLRPGKGDAMNTALQRAEGAGIDRLHFYDADILNFDSDWIDGAEEAADRGFEVVRHTFPRAATDAMITWFVTRPMLAIKYPGTILPRIGQPLGGELLLTREAISDLARNEDVRSRSDWGIDTVLTHAAVASGFSLYEHHVPDGKQHALYGSLVELRDMVLECFDAAASLDPRQPPPVRHQRDADAAVPESLKATTAYDYDSSARIVTATPSPQESDLIKRLQPELSRPVRDLAERGDWSGLDAPTWYDFLTFALPRFQLGDPGWDAFLFRMWTGRVLWYTTKVAIDGYDAAMGYLESTVRGYEQRAGDISSRR